MRQYTGSVCRDTNALTERRKPTDWSTTDCAKFKKAGRARTRGGPDSGAREEGGFGCVFRFVTLSGLRAARLLGWF